MPLPPLHVPLQFSHLQNFHLCRPSAASLAAHSKRRGYLALHQAPGKIPPCKRSRAASRKLKTLPGRLRGRCHNRLSRSRRELGPWLSSLPGKTQLFPLDRGPLPAATQRASSTPRQTRTCGRDARTPAAISPQRRAGTPQESQAPAGWVRVPTPRAPAPGVLSAPPRSSERQRSPTLRNPREGCLGSARCPAVGTAWGCRRGSVWGAPGPGWEGAPRPLRPPPTPARGKQQERDSLPPPIQAGAQLPLPWPGRRALCKGRAPGRAEPTPARPGVERGGRSLPKPTPPGTAAWSRGDSWARQSSAAAAGRHPRSGSPAASPSRALRLQHREERGQPAGRAAKLQNSGSPRRPSLALLGFSCAVPCSGRLPGPPWLSSTLCPTKKISLEQEKDDPLDLQPKAPRDSCSPVN